MNKTAAFVASFLLTASLCFAAGYYRELLALPRAVAGGAAPTLTASFLLHFDDASGSTTTTDSGKYGLAVTAQGNAFITNAPSKFSNNASLSGANGRRFEVAYTNDFAPGTNDWSFDFWLYVTGAKATEGADWTAIGGYTNNTMRSFIWMYKQSGTGSLSNIRIDLSTNGASATKNPIFNYNVTDNSNNWIHFAVFRYTNTLHLYTNGAPCTRQGSASDFNVSGAVFAPLNTQPFRVGGRQGANTGPTCIDEVRYCVGSAMPYRGTNFAPPAAPYTGYE
jgi:hypothetical protein